MSRTSVQNKYTDLCFFSVVQKEISMKLSLFLLIALLGEEFIIFLEIENSHIFLQYFIYFIRRCSLIVCAQAPRLLRWFTHSPCVLLWFVSLIEVLAQVAEPSLLGLQSCNSGGIVFLTAGLSEEIKSKVATDKCQ